MKTFVYNITAVAAVSALLGLSFGACTRDSNDPATEFAVSLASVSDANFDAGNEYEATYTVAYDNGAPEYEVVAITSLEGVPNGIVATVLYYNIGEPTDGSVAPLSSPTLPYQAVVNYNVESGAIPGSYTITVSVDPDGEEVTGASESFTLTVNDPGSGSTDCNTNLAGNYAGPGTCAPQGWGDTHVDVFVTTDPDNVEVYVEFFDQGSTVLATLDCNNSSFTIAQQTVTFGNGAQQVNIEGSGTWIFGQADTTLVLIYEGQVVGSSDPPATCQVDLTKQ